MSTVTAPSFTSVFLPRVRVNTHVFMDLKLHNVEKHGVKVSFAEADRVASQSIREIARSGQFSTRHAPRLYCGDLNLRRDYVELSDVKVEGSQENVQVMVDMLTDADRTVEYQHPEFSMSIYFWGLPEKAIREFSKKFSDVLPGRCIYGFSFHGVFNRKFVHGKSVFDGNNARYQAFLKAVESFGGFYIVSQETLVRLPF